MASLVLLLEAIMRCCQNEILPKEETKEANYDDDDDGDDTNNAPTGEHFHYIGNIVKKVVEDVHTWKIAEFASGLA